MAHVTDEYRIRYSAELDTFAASPPGDGPVCRVRDVIVCVNDPNVEIPSEQFEAHPPSRSSTSTASRPSQSS